MASTASHIATDAGAATAAQADTQQTQPVPQTTTAATATPQICEFFLRDVCRFGERCRNVHPQPAKVETVQSAAGRLRPAHDVIARLQWDACMTSPATTTTTDGDISVEETQPRLQHVTVGYLDRFEGMQEVPFAQFNWSAELADAEEDELCIPRHRIWYFKYRGRLMWDRRSRVDQVFGGQRLETFVEMCDQAAAKQAEEVEAAEAAAATATAMDTAGDETPAGPALAAKSDVVVVAVPLTMGAADRLTAAQAAVLTRHPELALHQTPAAGR